MCMCLSKAKVNEMAGKKLATKYRHQQLASLFSVEVSNTYFVLKEQSFAPKKIFSGV